MNVSPSQALVVEEGLMSGVSNRQVLNRQFLFPHGTIRYLTVPYGILRLSLNANRT